MAKPNPCKDFVRTSTGEWIRNETLVSKQLAKKLDNLRLPPAWKNVVVSADPKAKVVAIGQDKAGRWQYRYSAKHVEASSRAKFYRVKSFSRDMPALRTKIAADINVGDTRALLLRLEDKTAMRVGSTRDVGAKVQAYGLTTLKHEHIVIRGNKIIFDFVAKKGIPAHYEIVDDVLAQFLRERQRKTVVGQYLFPDVDGKKINAYIKKLSGKAYSIKDYRTYHATRIAFEELRGVAGQTLTRKTKKRLIDRVSTKVSEFLHNTPVMAKNSYIDPMVWELIGGI